MLRELARPDGLVVTLVVRDEQVIMPRGPALQPGDHVFVALRKQVKPLVDRLFARAEALPPLPFPCRLQFPAYTTRAQLKHFFALQEALPAASGAETLGRLLERAQHRGDPEARIGPLWIGPGPDDDVITVRTLQAAR